MPEQRHEEDGPEHAAQPPAPLEGRWLAAEGCGPIEGHPEHARAGGRQERVRRSHGAAGDLGYKTGDSPVHTHPTILYPLQATVRVLQKQMLQMSGDFTYRRTCTVRAVFKICTGPRARTDRIHVPTSTNFSYCYDYKYYKSLR